MRQTVRSSQLARSKNLLTKEKIYMLIRLYCETASNSTWQLSDEASTRFGIGELKFSDIYGGEPPQFEHTFGRGQFSRSSQSNSSKTSSLNTSGKNFNPKNNVNSSAQSSTASKKPTKGDLSDDDIKANAFSKDPNSEVNQNALRIVQILDKKGILN